MRTWQALLLVLILPGRPEVQSAPPITGPSQAVPQVHVVVFDFVCKDRPEHGKKLADVVRLKLRRHEEYDVIDRLTTQEFSAALPADIDREKIQELMTGLLGAQIGLCGTIRATGKVVQAEIRYVDLRDPGNPTEWTKVFTDDTERWGAIIGTEIVESVTGRPEWKPPEYGDEPTPTNFGAPVNINGGFEDGHKGWEHPDNVSTMIVKTDDGGGHMLKIRTDLAREPWLEYTRKLRFGDADPTKPPNIPSDSSYGCVGGLEGVHYRSEWIEATPGQRYWLTADAKGLGGAKIFIKGYMDWTKRADGLPEASLVQRGLTPESFAKLSPEQRKKIIAEDTKLHAERYRREVYRWYLNCASAKGKWKRLAAPVPPRGGLPKNVQWIQIQVYAYWPPGSYYFDNVHLYKDPNQKAPLPEEPPRTPGFEKIRIQAGKK